MSTACSMTLALALGACGGEGTHSLIVDVRSDLAPGIELVVLQGELEAPTRLEMVGTPIGAPLADGVRLAEWDGLTPGTYVLTVSALDAAGGVVVARRIRVTLRDESLALTVTLTRSCRTVTCGSNETCVAASCVSEECSEVNLEACGMPECSSAAECTATAACSVAACVEGGCFTAPDDSLCAPDEACSPDIGCVPRPGMDAGMDAAADGGLDSASDALGDAGDGGAWITSSPVSISTIGNPRNPTIDVDDAGNVLGIVWESDGDCWFGGVDATTGDPIGGEVRASDASPERTRFCHVVWVGTGWGVVWEDERGGVGMDAIYYTKLAPDGTKLIGDVLVSDGFRSVDPDLAFSGTEVGVIYLDDRDPRREAYFVRIDPDDGSQLGASTRITTSTERSRANPAIVWSGDEWVAVWDDNNDVFVARLDTSGVEIGDEVALSMDGDSTQPKLAVGPSPAQYGLVFENAAETQVRFGRVDVVAGRASLTAAISGSGAATNPALTWTGATWEVYFEEVVGADDQIRGRSFSPSDMGPLTTITTDPAFSRDPGVVFTGRSVALVWEDERAGVRQIWVELRAPL